MIQLNFIYGSSCDTVGVLYDQIKLFWHVLWLNEIETMKEALVA